jgi:hypothetical protein
VVKINNCNSKLVSITITSIMAPDLRKVIGSKFTTFAKYVTNKKNCSLYFGLLAGSKKLNGVVTEEVVARHNPTNRAQTYITAYWDMETGRTKLQKVHIRYITLKEDVPVATAPATSPVNNETPASLGEDININSDINEPNDNEPPTVTVNTTEDPGRNLLASLDAIIAADDAAKEAEIAAEAAAAATPPLAILPIAVVPTVAVAEQATTITEQTQWFPYRDVGYSINGAVPYRDWGLRVPTGKHGGREQTTTRPSLESM